LLFFFFPYENAIFVLLCAGLVLVIRIARILPGDIDEANEVYVKDKAVCV
jgi:hypothetical protein